MYAPRDRAGRTDDALMESGARAGTQVRVCSRAAMLRGLLAVLNVVQGTVDAEMTPGATRGQTRGSFATKKR